VYREYYDAKTSHRRLQWTYSLGQCNVKGTFGGKKVFELQVTTLQAIVMLAFNKDKVLLHSLLSPLPHLALVLTGHTGEERCVLCLFIFLLPAFGSQDVLLSCERVACLQPYLVHSNVLTTLTTFCVASLYRRVPAA
jgi:hypothetical protein